MKPKFSEEARWELRDAVRYYDAQRPGLGTEFRDEVRSAVQRIQDFPEAWAPPIGDARRCRVKRFPYGLIYKIREKEITVIAVSDLRREPGRWRDRI